MSKILNNASLKFKKFRQTGLRLGGGGEPDIIMGQLHLLLVESRDNMMAKLGGRVAKGIGLWPLACWDYGFEFRWGEGCMSLMNAVCCQV